jgi:hypothetical protein
MVSRKPPESPALRQLKDRRISMRTKVFIWLSPSRITKEKKPFITAGKETKRNEGKKKKRSRETHWELNLDLVALSAPDVPPGGHGVPLDSGCL